jgi:hypothetical protein
MTDTTRPLRFALALLIAIPALVPVARAGAIDELMKRQRNGYWETSIRGADGRPMAFCVTDTVKVGALRQTRDAMMQLGCRTDRDVVSGDRFEMQLACRGADANVGSFRVTMKGEMRGDYFASNGTISGGGPLVQAIAASPDLRRSEWRWKRPCAANEKPGLQRG